MIVAASAVVVVRIAPEGRARFKILDGFNDTDRYTIATSPGASGVTFVGCPAGYMGPTTVFWVGYLDAGLTCIPFTVQTLGRYGSAYPLAAASARHDTKPLAFLRRPYEAARSTSLWPSGAHGEQPGEAGCHRTP